LMGFSADGFCLFFILCSDFAISNNWDISRSGFELEE
jgi:hypothetical protein